MIRGFIRLAAAVPLICGMLGAVAAPRPAHAIALFDGKLDSVLTLIRFTDDLGNTIAAPNGVTVAADPCACAPYTDQFGTGTADTAGHALGSSVAMQPGDAVDLSSRSFGSALLPDGYGIAIHDAEAIVDIANFSSQTVRAVFQLAYSWDLSVSVDDLDTEQAAGNLYIDILGGILDIDDSFIANDVDVLIDELFDSFDLAAPGVLHGAGGDVIEFSILLNPGDVGAIDMFVGTYGVADAFIDIPAPGTLAIFLPALLLAGAQRRRRGG